MKPRLLYTLNDYQLHIPLRYNVYDWAEVTKRKYQNRIGKWFTLVVPTSNPTPAIGHKAYFYCLDVSIATFEWRRQRSPFWQRLFGAKLNTSCDLYAKGIITVLSYNAPDANEVDKVAKQEQDAEAFLGAISGLQIEQWGNE
jgi:hypothetical protein